MFVEKTTGIVPAAKRSSGLGFDPFGVDGIFGGRSRAAIRNWQASANLEASGYLTANQVTRLENAAARRAEQLRREAEERRRAEERADRRYWQRTGQSGAEDGLPLISSDIPTDCFLIRPDNGFVQSNESAAVWHAQRSAPHGITRQPRTAFSRIANMSGPIPKARSFRRPGRASKP